MKRAHVLTGEKFTLSVDHTTGEGKIVAPLVYDFDHPTETEGALFAKIELSVDDLNELAAFLQTVILR